MNEKKEMKKYQKPALEAYELEGGALMADTSEIGFGEGGGDANGMRNPFETPFGGNPFSNPFGMGF